MRLRMRWIACGSFLFTSTASAQTAGMLSFQGLIKDAGGTPITTPVDLTFEIFDSEVGGNSVAGPFAQAGVSPADGMVSTKFGPVPASAFNGSPRWLEVSIDDGGGPEPLPRIEMATAPATAEQINIPGTGTPAIHVDSAGNVGIGTTAPLYSPFTVNADAAASCDGMVIYDPNELPNECTDLFFGTNPSPAGDTLLGIIRAVIVDGDPNPLKSKLEFYVNPGDSAVRAMTIRETGRVGIGTDNPISPLHVAGHMRSQGGDVVSTNPNNPDAVVFLGWLNDVARIRVGGDGAGAGAGLDVQAPNNVSLMRVQGDGKVGIGTTTPREKLDVAAEIAWGSAYNILAQDQGGSIELGGNSSTPNPVTGGRPFIDFHYGTGTAQDYNVRIINESDRMLTLDAARVYCIGEADVDVLRIRGGSDLAESFEIRAATERRSDEATKAAEPGMVVVIDPANPGALKLASEPYDKTVAGIISGANGLSPGMIMKAEGHPHADGEHPVALTGRVWCWADAAYGAIEPGDRLTTSATPGHAMKVMDEAKAPGAVIGKAMTPLKEGQRLVLVLVQPQ